VTVLPAAPRSRAIGAARATAVVVASHDTGGLRRLLVGLRHPHLELVVVNVEADPAIRQAAGGATVVDLPRSRGFAAAVHQGVRRAHAPIVVFMPDDASVDAARVLRLAESARRRAEGAAPPGADGDGATARTVVPLPGVGALAEGDGVR
jgi:hypothetical protein